MDESCGLAQGLAEGLDGILVALQASVDHTSVVVVSDDLDRLGSTHYRCDRMLNNGESMRQASCF